MNSVCIEKCPQSRGSISDLDEDGRKKRTGTWTTANAHIITAVIGSGVLSLAWTMAQLGWVPGSIALIVFSLITFYTSSLQADCYRSPDPITGVRNYTYGDVVKTHLGGVKVQLCKIAQFANLIGATIGYTITASISMLAIRKSNCFHANGHDADCGAKTYPFMIIFALLQIILSQIPNFHKLSWLSVVAAIMSFAYSTIGLILSIIRLANGERSGITTLTGVVIGVDVNSITDKVWKCCQAIGNIAFAYTFSCILIEIQDTLRSHPPENKEMKKASLVAVLITTVFYMLCGCLGYAAFGNNSPGNFLTGFGFYEPYWLVDIGNICIVLHLLGSYQVFSQPLYQAMDTLFNRRWPENEFITKNHSIRVPFTTKDLKINYFRLVSRTIYVICTGMVAIVLPFFNEFIGLIGAVSFYPLTVYFPIEMHIAQAKVPKFSPKWIWLKLLSTFCCLAAIAGIVGSIQGLVQGVKTFKPFTN